MCCFLVFGHFPIQCPGSGVVFDCIDSWSLPSFLLCYERDIMMPLSDDKHAIFDAFNTASRYLDDIININIYFDNMVSQIYSAELQLNKANASNTEAPFLDLHLSISNDIVSTKVYDKRDDFDFEIVNFPFFDDDVPRSTSYLANVECFASALISLSSIQRAQLSKKTLLYNI